MGRSKIRVVYEYEFRRGTQTARSLNEVFGEDVANERTVSRRFEKFRSGDYNLENQPCSRPETNVDNDELETVVAADTSQTTHRPPVVRNGIDQSPAISTIGQLHLKPRVT
ncbi:histone-lysine N-methyltransferase SETMAR-like [Octopus bimaculoides]|uniref:histone-lysine N-methyltransferase SETMAR-like n=1 Tax=Octopus bimaculoides TaxID=37653 RepID=UPI00071CE6CC|nr:histone-lysine N-methyltransferase SETMAR-like [Octopus bimaculoides]|eukprot:XP_014772226.1 PREDICTED: histone-lysine N-methyltransferase SETMAR-like [Octopus bimaculoides]